MMAVGCIFGIKQVKHQYHISENVHCHIPAAVKQQKAASLYCNALNTEVKEKEQVT